MATTRKTTQTTDPGTVPAGTVVVVEPYTAEWRQSVRDAMLSARSDESAAWAAVDKARADLAELNEVRRYELNPRTYVTERDVLTESIERLEHAARAATARLKAAERADQEARYLMDPAIGQYVAEQARIKFRQYADGLPLGKLTVRPAGRVRREEDGWTSGEAEVIYDGKYPFLVEKVLAGIPWAKVSSTTANHIRLSVKYLDAAVAHAAECEAKRRERKEEARRLGAIGVD